MCKHEQQVERAKARVIGREYTDNANNAAKLSHRHRYLIAARVCFRRALGLLALLLAFSTLGCNRNVCLQREQDNTCSWWATPAIAEQVKREQAVLR